MNQGKDPFLRWAGPASGKLRPAAARRAAPQNSETSLTCISPNATAFCGANS